MHRVLRGAMLLGGIGQHEQPGFVVLILPGLQKPVGRRQGGDIAGVRAAAIEGEGLVLAARRTGKRQQIPPPARCKPSTAAGERHTCLNRQSSTDPRKRL